jgi:hypothetical protein
VLEFEDAWGWVESNRVIDATHHLAELARLKASVEVLARSVEAQHSRLADAFGNVVSPQAASSQAVSSH